MKKSLLLSAVAVCALSLSAQEMEEVTSSAVMPQKGALLSQPFRAFGMAKTELGTDNKIDLSSQLLSDVSCTFVQMADSNSDSDKKLILKPYYRMPFSFHQALTFGSGDDAKDMFFYMMPYNSEFSYGPVFSCAGENYTSMEELQADVNAAAAVAKYSWKYVNPEMSAYVTSDNKILKTNYFPQYNAYTALDAPALTVTSGEMTGEYQSDNTLYFGGVFQWKSTSGLKQFSVYPFDCATYDQSGFCAAYGLGTAKVFSDADDTWTSYTEQLLTLTAKKYMFTDQANQIDTVVATGFAQMVPKPVIPYALSSLTLQLALACEGAASYKVAVYYVSDEGKIGDKIIEQEVSYTTPQPVNFYPFTQKFTSKNSYGETLNYMMIDKALYVEISDVKGFSRFSPYIYGYLEDGMGAKLESAYMAYNIGNVMGTDGSVMYESVPMPIARYFSFGKAKIKYNTMAIEMDIEYPFLSLSGSYDFASQNWTDVKGQTVEIPIASESAQALFECYTSATKDSQIEITMADGDFLPDWLIAEPKVGMETLQSGTIVQFAQIAFSIDEKELKGVKPAEWKGNVVATYKNQKITFKVNGGISGVNNIVDDAIDADVVSSEYFDLQGRKLNAQPENGIFIQKSLLSNGKSVATKIAK